MRTRMITQDKPLEAGFRGFGRVPTDDQGRFRFTTIKPGRVAAPGGGLQAPHVNVTILMRGMLEATRHAHLLPRGSRQRGGCRPAKRSAGTARDTDSQSRQRAVRARWNGTSSSRAPARPFSSIAEGVAFACSHAAIPAPP